MMRPDWTYGGNRGEFLAGWHDACRTPNAQWWRGRRFGDVFYAAGYAVGAWFA